MKKLLLPLLAVLLFTACQKQISKESLTQEVATGINRTSPKILICHHDVLNNTYKTISINLTAWPDHQSHGDVRLDDQDGDGYVPTNACGYGTQGDCNDANIAINPGTTEICGNGIDENCNGSSDDVCSLSIGASYQGGIIAYILLPEDPGYDANTPHGLIAAAADQIIDAPWGCFGTEISGADGTDIGTGNQNTIDIMADCGTAGIAASICSDLVLGGKSDWYLPSKDELNKLYINRIAIGGFFSDGYWTSSESDSNHAYLHSFVNGVQASDSKSYEFRVRAVRAF